jgi:hypothetical protein
MTDFTKLATEALERAEKATKELGEVCAKGPGNRFRMTVPANPEKDTDLLIGASLDDVPTLAHAVLELVEDARTADNFSQDRIDALQAEVERLRDIADYVASNASGGDVPESWPEWVSTALTKEDQ